ncbi:hypothetical protein P4597_11900 [Peribacillus simplex]|uniref:hypothetical protein n=1 Tax=Peribacillus simplex TaxID=1478 RepID=UPI002E241739|nr:hypothetical protein [Peribacillus simplex]
MFEKRLGGTVFRPIGTEWNSKGFWKALVCPDPVKIYLEIGTPMHNQVVRYFNVNNPGTSSLPAYLCQDDSGFINKAITLDTFFQIPVDIVIASLPAHIEPFTHLCKIHPNKPKLIYQIGNAWPIEAGLAPNVMASALINDLPNHIHFISYHQEFDISIFYPDFSYPGQNIYSFVNCFNAIEAYDPDWQLFESVEKLMPDWNFKSYGGLCRDNRLDGFGKVAKRMRESRFIWHTKYGGDGYGHVVYNSAAVARPMIVKMEYYQDKLGRELMIDGETCLAIDGLSPQEVVNKILYYSDEKRYATLCKNVYKIFKEKVDFDKEENAMQSFINGLI